MIKLYGKGKGQAELVYGTECEPSAGTRPSTSGGSRARVPRGISGRGEEDSLLNRLCRHNRLALGANTAKLSTSQVLKPTLQIDERFEGI